MPPASIRPLSGGRGYTWRATTQSRSPPPIQSIEASPRPARIQIQCSRPRAARNAGKLLPYRRVAPKPRRDATAKTSKPRSSSLGVRRRGIDEQLSGRAGHWGSGNYRLTAVPPYRLGFIMPDSHIRIVNARQNNLRNITVDLPHRSLIVVTGPSGSGKSTLAFDTLYAEGQRRYIESLSTYAKQFLDRIPNPLVDRLEGIAPAVAIEQRNPVVSSRSTVGTATEVYDYLRLLWARVGRCYCRRCGSPVRKDTPDAAADEVLAQGPGRVQVCFPLPP